MEPTVRQQGIVSDQVDIQLDSEMFAFGYYSVLYSKTLMELEEEQNILYKVFFSYFFSSVNGQTQVLPLNIVKCQSPQLKGLYCIDFSKYPDLHLTNLADFGRQFSYIAVTSYNCLDSGQITTTVPQNCSNQTQSDIINNYSLFYKIKTSYFDTTSQVIQDQYKVIQGMSLPDVFAYEELQIQKSITNVKKGFLIQQQETYSFLNSFNYQSSVIPRSQVIQEGSKMLSEIMFRLDESIIYNYIQYPIFTQVLALCNSVLALLILLGYFCRRMAQSFIRRDISFILLQNLFLGTYFNVINSNKIVNFNEPIQEQQSIQTQENQESKADVVHDSQRNILPQLFTPKSSQIVFEQLLTSNCEKKENDFIKEEHEQENLNLNFDQQQKFKLKRVESFQNSINLEKNLRVFVPNMAKNEQSYPQKSNLQQKGNNSPIIKDRFITQKNNNFTQKVNQLNQNGIQKNQIKNINLIKKQTEKHLKILNDISTKQKLEKILFGNKLCKHKDNLYSKGFNQDVQDQLEKSIDESLDFFKFYKEIIFLKKAVMILLSKEQLAALNLIGIAIEQIKPNQINTAMSTLQDEINLNHLQEQFKVLQSQELQLEQIKLFLSRCEGTENLDVIDHRILSSMLLNQSK